MKKIICMVSMLFFIGCATKNSSPVNKPLFEVLTSQTNGGASIRFYEILSEPNEIKMLLSDPNLRKKIKQDDIQNSNFLILNMGEKTSGGFKIEVGQVIETATNIEVTVHEIVPSANQNTISVMTNPYSIVKINSKKPIIFK
jgi:hypothetical protein